jgi:hypothetical protein
MAVLGDTRDRAVTTLVCLHDLLGYGELIASSGGTLDSAAGEIAYNRIVALRQSLETCAGLFPSGTTLFHFNDTATAILDVEVMISSSHTDSSGIANVRVQRDECHRILKFLGACAALHQQSISTEEEARLGPAGRTFVVLGKRWDLPTRAPTQALHVPTLQANLAFAEAYAADSIGSSGGFGQRSFYNLYVNDYLWHVLITMKLSLTPADATALSELGNRDEGFPRSLMSPDVAPIDIFVFHRRRRFYSLMSHHGKDLTGVFHD